MENMDNFLRVNNVTDVNFMYGKEVYLTLFPDESKEHFIYKGTLLGYGAYGKDPEHKTFCVYVDRGDGYRFVDFFRDRCFKAKDDYYEFVRSRKEKCSDIYTVERLKKILNLEEDHIDVKVKVGDMVYPVNGMADQAKSVKEPAFVLKVDVEKVMAWEK